MGAKLDARAAVSAFSQESHEPLTDGLIAVESVAFQKGVTPPGGHGISRTVFEAQPGPCFGLTNVADVAPATKVS